MKQFALKGMVLAAGAAASLLFGVTRAHAVGGTCTFDSGTATVSASLTGDGMTGTLARSGDAITLNGISCGAATVLNTDTIKVTGDSGSQTLAVDLGNGPFEPGKTGEPSGTSEIEFTVDLGPQADTLILKGTSGDDNIRLGDLGVNLNADDDADIVETSTDLTQVEGLGGGDTLDASGGLGTGNPLPYSLDLRLEGGPQNDTLVSGDADTTFDGGSGDDIELGGSGQDMFDEEPTADGSDDLVGGPGNAPDTVDYSARTNAVSVSLDGVANDGSPAAAEQDNVHSDIDIVYGGSGNDTIVDPSAQYTARTFAGGPGADTITGGIGGDTLYGCYPIAVVPQFNSCTADAGDTLSGGDGSDDMYGGFGNDKEYGGAGNERFYEDYEEVPNGADEIHGGTSKDWVIYNHRTTPLTLTLNDNVANDGAAGENDNVFADVEDVTGGRSSNTITGNLLNNSISAFSGGSQVWSGGGGDDFLDAGTNTVGAILHGDAGDDTIYGGSAKDSLYGDNGSDHVDGGPNNDQIEGGPDSDQVRGGLGNDLLNEGAAPSGADDLQGGGGLDTAYYADRLAPVDVSVDDAANDGATGEGDNVHFDVENVAGGFGNDLLSGSTIANQLSGNGGNDTLTGLGGNDNLIPGLGNDTVDGGAGIDTASYFERTSRVIVSIDDVANDGDPLLSERDNVETSVENLQGGSGNDVLAGSSGPNEIFGNDGIDTLAEGSSADGADDLWGGEGTDTVTYSDRATRVIVSLDDQPNDGDPLANAATGEKDNVHSDVENVQGGHGPDQLVGNSDANFLQGNDGMDYLVGGLGRDTLSGDADTDTASYSDRSTGVTASLDGVRNDGAPGENDLIQADVENLTGSLGKDTLTGGAGNNVLNGLSGDDTLIGLAGADVFLGSGGIDTVDYSARTADLDGSIDGLANDGEPGEQDNVHTDVENLVGGSGDDELDGGANDNRIEGGPGADMLFGAGGNDVLDGGTGGDTMFGGAGLHDRAAYEDRTLPVKVSIDDLANDGYAGELDNVRTDVEDVTGGSGDDTLTGSAGANTLGGGPGDDVLDGKAGADVLDGQDGTDQATYADRINSVTVTLDGLANDGETGEGDNVKTENVMGGRWHDKIVGDAGPNVLDGFLGNDKVWGADGDDVLYGNFGNDDVQGGSGDDTIYEGTKANGSDSLMGGTGIDKVSYYGRTADLTIVMDGGFDDGESGEQDNVRTDVEKVDGGKGNDDIEDASINGINNDYYGGPGDDKLRGGQGTDVLRGAGGADDMNGGVGDDTIKGGPGDDLLDGDEGNDKLYGEDGNDKLIGWGGNDLLIGGFSDYHIVDTGNDTIDGNGGDDDIRGGAGNDTIDAGDDGDHYVDGGDGDDTIRGGGDFITTNDGADNLYGGEGSDHIYGGMGADLIEGDNGDDFLYGEKGDDRFYGSQGGDGADRYDGGYYPDSSGGDQLEYSPYITADLSINANDNLANDGVAGEGDNVLDNIEIIRGAAGNDTITGNGWDNKLYGGPGNDSLNGLGGNDTLNGEEGDDQEYGGAGNDFLGSYLSPAQKPDSGTDDMRGQDGDDTFKAKDGVKDFLYGGNGTDGGEWDLGLDVTDSVEG